MIVQLLAVKSKGDRSRCCCVVLNRREKGTQQGKKRDEQSTQIPQKREPQITLRGVGLYENHDKKGGRNIREKSYFVRSRRTITNLQKQNGRDSGERVQWKSRHKSYTQETTN